MNEQLEEQAALYALDLLEPAERTTFEAQLAADAELRNHVDALTETAAQMAHAAPRQALPAHLEERVLREIRKHRIPTTVLSTASTSWIPWALAACLAVACVVAFARQQGLVKELTAARAQEGAAQSRIAALAEERDRARQEVVQLEQQAAEARTQMATLAAAGEDAAKKLAQAEARAEREEKESRNALAEMQVATLTSKLTNAPNATAAVVWDAEGQRGVLNTVNVPPNAADRDYQLWIVDPRYNDPVSAGVFSVEQRGSTRYAFKPKSRITSATAFAISLERKGGVPKAEGPIVLVGK